MVREWRSVHSELLDEAQFEMKHKLLKYKRFEDETSCKEWISQQQDEWLVLHTEKGWFAAYSEVFAICRESVALTSKAYKLNVKLGIDPQLGLDWASCH